MNVNMEHESDEEGQEAQHNTTMDLLSQRRLLTERLHELPYDLVLYIERAIVHSDLGYPDLAASDAYRALLLIDEVRDEGFEYHEVALEALRPHLTAAPTWHGTLEERVSAASVVDGEETEVGVESMLDSASKRCYRILAISLLLCGCLKSAYEFSQRGLAKAPSDEELLQAQEYILNLARRRLKSDTVDVADFPDQGLVRREIYPWNDHEPDRYSPETLDWLNAKLAQVTPKCIAKVTELPTLVDGVPTADENGNIPTNKQLGLFAKEDIAPEEVVLDEVSVLTANNRFQHPLCDACSSELPGLGDEEQAVPCEECHEIMFCSQKCHDLAMETYHPAVCEKDIEAITITIAKGADAKEIPDMLYLLLLSRSFAMASTQEVHPLDLEEVKYIWGDFLLSSSNAVPLSPKAGPPPIWTLPFSFKANITGPLHVLEKMDIDIFASVREYDLWVFNTLYSKFRGTASARVSKHDGRPEVAAVHPLWCLANHDCNPNVQWEWGGRMKLWARKKRLGDKTAGVRKGEEILNHYTDIDLPVQKRREWAQGSLGGFCMCERCRKEAGEEGQDDIQMVDAGQN
jgi:hypothetical protein